MIMLCKKDGIKLIRKRYIIEEVFPKLRCEINGDCVAIFTSGG